MHEVTADLRGRGMLEPSVQQIVRLHELAFNYFRTGDHSQAEAYINEYDRLLTTDFAAVVKEFPRDPDEPDMQWARKIYGFEPLIYWRRLNCPSLVIFGADDETHLIPVAESVARFKKIGANAPGGKLTVETISGTGHTLGNSTGSDFHPEMRSLLSHWLMTNTGASHVKR